MKILKHFTCIIICCITLFFMRCTQVQEKTSSLPFLQQHEQATRLMVDGKPYLVLGGELHNSSSSSPEYMKDFWPLLKQAGLNTVLAVVSWDLIEPEEGRYDFSLVDSLLRDARKHDLRLILLWFGSWKNGQSHYIPEWVKKDYKRFPRVKAANGKSLEILTPVSTETRDADTRAYTAFMRHLKEVDSKHHTVIMIQIQNEVGILGDSRDRGDKANELFHSAVPETLMSWLKENEESLFSELLETWHAAGKKDAGAWEEVFGQGPATDELFMAWHYASFINAMAAAGKAEYPLPVFVNAWIVQPEDKLPGDYPSGGPQAHVHDIWQAAAPDIDILAPDIYLPDFPGISRQYMRHGNPLFVPESFAGEPGAANAFYAFGQLNAIGYSPFGIENRIDDFENGIIPRTYKVLANIAHLILENQGKGTIAAVSLSKENPSDTIRLGDYLLEAELMKTFRSDVVPELGYGLFISTGDDEYYIAGNNIQVSFTALTPGPKITGLASVEEGRFVDDQWVRRRKLNGDDIMINYRLAEMAAMDKTGTTVRLPNGPTIRKVRLYRYE